MGSVLKGTFEDRVSWDITEQKPDVPMQLKSTQRGKSLWFQEQTGHLEEHSCP